MLDIFHLSPHDQETADLSGFKARLFPPADRLHGRPCSSEAALGRPTTEPTITLDKGTQQKLNRILVSYRGAKVNEYNTGNRTLIISTCP